MSDTTDGAMPLCSGHPEVCCECCREFQSDLEDARTLYMDNEKEWQQVFLTERSSLLSRLERAEKELKIWDSEIGGLNLGSTDGGFYTARDWVRKKLSSTSEYGK